LAASASAEASAAPEQQQQPELLAEQLQGDSEYV
jgi:hypothetical protein